MGSFGVTNPLMSKTTTHSRFMTSTSAVASIEAANQTALACGELQQPPGFGGLSIRNAHAT